MAKINNIGYACKRVNCDLVEFNISVKETDVNQDLALKFMNETMESLLQELVKLGIDIKDIRQTTNQISDFYDQDGQKVMAMRTISFMTPYSGTIINDINSILSRIDGEFNLHTSFMLSNQESYRQELLDLAINKAQEEAKKIAKSMDMKLEGLKNVDVSDMDFVSNKFQTMDLAYKMERERVYSDDLSAEFLNLEVRVETQWEAK